MQLPSRPQAVYHSDVLVLGAGGAGLTAAVTAAEKGFSVHCISKVYPIRSHTAAAQGGINAALGNIEEDDWRWHMYDTVRGSDWLGDQDAIALLCSKAPEAIYWLERRGLPFTRLPDGKLYQRVYGGQSGNFGETPPPPRACAAADRTGHTLLQTLHQQALQAGVKCFSQHMAISLIIEKGQCKGLVVLDVEAGELMLFLAQAVVIATGGSGQMYHTTTSSSICTGDGQALVLLAGLPLQDMECIQFHPTGLYGSGFLITEAARAEGGYLVNKEGERFMQRYAPRSGDLASRDVIARAMMQEIAEGRGCGEKGDHLHLCVGHLGEKLLRKKLPTTLETAHTFARLDAAKQPVPVRPSVHYTMGGIPTNARAEVVQDAAGNILPGLYAIGEAASASVHGANRLGCNGLLELVVFGRQVIESIAETISPGKKHSENGAMLENAAVRLTVHYNPKGEKTPAQLRREMQIIMEHHAGVIRDKDTLAAGMKQMQALYRSLGQMQVKSAVLAWNNPLSEALEVSGMVMQALCVLGSALAREESRGSHFRSDFPKRNDKKWQRHTLSAVDAAGQVSIGSAAVRMHTGMEGVDAILPQERGY